MDFRVFAICLHEQAAFSYMKTERHRETHSCSHHPLNTTAREVLELFSRKTGGELLEPRKRELFTYILWCMCVLLSWLGLSPIANSQAIHYYTSGAVLRLCLPSVHALSTIYHFISIAFFYFLSPLICECVPPSPSLF